MSTAARPHYPTNLTDAQWAVIEPLLPEPKSEPGQPGCPVVDRRRVIDGILYVNKAGGQWRMLPREFGAWQTVYGYFNTWSKLTVWQGLMEELTDAERSRQERPAQPSAGCLDSQSVKAAAQPMEAVGFDGNKKVKGRKRHVLTARRPPTPSAWCCSCWSRRPTWMTGKDCAGSSGAGLSRGCVGCASCGSMPGM